MEENPPGQMFSTVSDWFSGVKTGLIYITTGTKMILACMCPRSCAHPAPEHVYEQDEQSEQYRRAHLSVHMLSAGL